jgi:type II secretory pathway component GspD/PulD (secretin)
VGLILGVTPRISPDGTVVMEIDAEKSTLGPESQGIPISATNDGTIIRAPTIETTRAQSTVSAASGETIVLGGLITKNHAVTRRTVPYLSDIPIVGELFSYDNKSNRRTELIIILTPQVIHGPEDNERIKQTEMARMSWCMADVYDLQGDVNYQFADNAAMLDQPTEVIYPDNQPGGFLENAPSAVMGNETIGGQNMNSRIINRETFPSPILESPLGRNTPSGP